MLESVISLLQLRASANSFDASHVLPDFEIEELVRLATLAPSAYNLQNWRFVAVRTAEAKARLRKLAFDQAKVSQAAVTFIVCGQLPNAAELAGRLMPAVKAGYMPAGMVSAWQDQAREQYADPQSARDEAVRSAALGAAHLMFAAQGAGLVSGAIGGFDAEAVARDFELGTYEVPVMLLAVGRAAKGNWPQKPRRPLAEVLDLV